MAPIALLPSSGALVNIRPPAAAQTRVQHWRSLGPAGCPPSPGLWAGKGAKGVGALRAQGRRDEAARGMKGDKGGRAAVVVEEEVKRRASSPKVVAAHVSNRRALLLALAAGVVGVGAEPNAALAAKGLPTLDDIVGPDPPAGAVDILDAGAGSMPGGEATDLAAPEPDLVPVVAEPPLNDEDRELQAKERLKKEKEEKAKKEKKVTLSKNQQILRELKEAEAELLEKEKLLLETEQSEKVLRQELELERKVNDLLRRQRDKAQEEAKLIAGFCGQSFLP